MVLGGEFWITYKWAVNSLGFWFLNGFLNGGLTGEAIGGVEQRR
jgi:hypothetical protein